MKQILLIFGILLMTGYSAQAQSKVAHVNTQTLLDTLPSRKKSIAEIQELNRRAEEELTELEKKLQKEYSDYMGRKGTQSEQLNQYDESRLNKMQQDAQARELELSNQLQEFNNTMNQKSLKTIQDAVASVARKKGITYVIDENSALYSSGLDITEEVIIELLRLDALSVN